MNKQLLLITFLWTVPLMASDQNHIGWQPTKTQMQIKKDCVVPALVGCSVCCGLAAECCCYLSTPAGCMAIANGLARFQIPFSGHESPQYYCAHEWPAQNSPHIQFVHMAGLCTGVASVGLIYACTFAFCGKRKRNQ